MSIGQKGYNMQTYYNPEDLKKFSSDGVGSAASDLWPNFMNYYGSVYQDGALTAREKHLIALGVAIDLQCPYCIDAHTQSLVNSGADADQIMEVYHTVATLRAGAAMAHGVQSLAIIEDNEL